MELKKVLVFCGLLGVFSNVLGAESSEKVKPSSLPPMKFLMEGASGARPVKEDSGVAIEKSSAELKESRKNGPLNVILLLVDELYGSDVLEYNKDRNEFPIHGHLETCTASFNSMVDGCDCDEKLGSSIASLISWAYHVNKSISGLYKVPISSSDPRARLIYYQRQEAPWFLKTKPTFNEENSEIAPKLEDVFFRNLVSSLNIDQVRGPSIVDHSTLKSISSALESIKWEQNKQGHLLIIRTEVYELHNVLEHLKRYVSTSNSLTIVMNSCSQGKANQWVPFFAKGLGSEEIYNAVNLKRLHDLPSAIHAVVDNTTSTSTFSLSDRSFTLHDRVNRSIYYGNHQRNKREEIELQECTTGDQAADVCVANALVAVVEKEECAAAASCKAAAMMAILQHYGIEVPVEASRKKRNINTEECHEPINEEYHACIADTAVAAIKACADDPCKADVINSALDLYRPKKEVSHVSDKPKSGQEAIIQSATVIVTALIASASYALKF